MALKYVVKKRVFGFDETKTEKYVAQPLLAGTVTFADLCDQVTKVGMAPRGVVKMVLDGLLDALEMNLVNGLSVRLGEFGSFRTSFGCKSQMAAEDVKADTLRNRKIIFTPGEQLKRMVKTVSIQKFEVKSTQISNEPGDNPSGEGDGEAPDPMG